MISPPSALWKDWGALLYQIGIGATLIVTAIRWVERRHRWINKVPRMDKNIKQIAKALGITLEDDED